MKLDRTSVRQIFFVLRFTWKYKLHLFLLTVISIFELVIGLFIPLVTGLIVDDALLGQDLQLFKAFIVATILFFVIKVIGNATFMMLSNNYITQFSMAFQFYVLRCALRLRYGKMTEYSSAALITRIMDDTAAVTQYVSLLLPNLICLFINTLLLTIICLFFNVPITCGIFIIVPLHLLVVPIDKAAPKGRLILPQQQTIRDILDAGACAVVCRDEELPQTLAKLAQPPRMVITDSQVFGKVAKMVPQEIPLTSFSILMARYKGDLELTVHGARAVETLRTGDKVLLAEGCTHHRQCGDIGTVKLPNWIRKATGTEPEFVFCSGRDFPDDLTEYKLVIHCGGCMLGQREMKYRQRAAVDQGVPITNYGILIAHLNGILARTIEPFPDLG